MKHDIDKNLSQMKIKPLTKEERDQTWQYVLTGMRQPVPSSRSAIVGFIRRPLLWGIVGLMFVFGGSVATAYAADDAKPGDLLFGIDRALENIQLRLASDQRRTELKLQMVQERLEEIQAILAESTIDDSQDPSADDPQDPLASGDDNGDENDDGEGNEDGPQDPSADDPQDPSADDPQDPSADGDENGFHSKEQERVEQAFAIALDFIAEIRESLLADGNLEAVAAIDAIVGEIDTEINALPSKWKFDIKKNRDKYKLTLDIRSADGKRKLKIKTNGGKIDIDYQDEDGKSKLKVKKNGKVKFKSNGKGKGPKDLPDEDTTEPVVVTFSPADNSTDVAVDTNLVITFSENVEAGSGNLTVKRVSDDTIVETLAVGSAAGSGTSVITFDLTSDLDNDTEFYVLMDEGSFADGASNSFGGISSTTVWNFTTVSAPDAEDPAVSTFSPADEATEVAVDSNLVIIFSENVVAGSGSITIKKAGDDSIVESIDVGSVAGLGTDTITIDLASDLESDTDYYVQIDATAFEDEAGNAYAGIADTMTWNFTTADIMAPVISSIVAIPSTTSSMITWITDEEADSAAWYGTSTPVFAQEPFLSVVDAAFVSDHSLDLGGLTASTTYNFIVVSEDSAGNESVSDEVSFTTLAL